MSFDELNKFLPINSEPGLFDFLEAAFAYRLKNKNYSGELATFIYNNFVRFLNLTDNSRDTKNKETLYLFARLFIKLDYIPYEDSKNDLEYEKKVDDAWREPYEIFIKEKEKRAR